MSGDSRARHSGFGTRHMNDAEMVVCTVGEGLNEVERRLAEGGIGGARAQAEQLVGHVLGWRWGELLVRREEPLPEGAVARMQALTRERLRRRPLQYVLGQTAFRDLVLRTDERALIPRPETELLVEEAVRRLRDNGCGDAGCTVADVGCGCGAIGLSLAAELPRATVILTDVSEGALELARENAAALPDVRDRVRFRLGPDLEPLEDLAGGLDAIVCNPPYVATGQIEALQPELRSEPGIALDGGADGFDFYRRLTGQWTRIVRPGGFLAVEVGAGHADSVRSLLAAEDDQVDTREDYQGIERIVVAVRA